MNFSKNRFPRRLLILTTVPLIALGISMIVAISMQLRAERKARRDNALDQTASQISDQIKAWSNSARVAALASELNASELLARFPDLASVQLFDANGRRALEQRRAGVLTLPDFSLESAALRAYVRRVGVWIAPLHVQRETSPRLPIVAALETHGPSRGFLVAEFRMNAIEMLLKRAALPMRLTPPPAAVRRDSRPIENLGLVLSLSENTTALPGLWIVVGMVASVLLLVVITGTLERRWSRRAADDIAHRERLMTIGATASAIGHELRTAFAVIRNAVDALKIRADLSDARCAKSVEAIETQIRLGNLLLSDLLEFARPRSVNMKPGNINPLIEDVLSMLGLPMSIRVDVMLTETIPLVSMDPDKMRQVLSNLFLNAADAMQNGGELKIATRPSGGHVLVEIRDTGTGMTPDVRQRLFEPFFSTKARGMGLGLSIVKKIVDAHSGHIQIDSVIGAGTTVTLTFPTSAPEFEMISADESATV